MRLQRFLSAGLILTFAMLLGGCVTAKDKSKELSRVAKDWCLTIRASQVMPVYPLTRDLQPGDVFLTTTAIGEEVALFEEKGFLPLDVHLVRLPLGAAVEKYYASHLGDGDNFPRSVTEWDDLPAAAFPTYSFEISRGGGLNLAIPVQGVPVGFNLLGSAAATGTVSLDEAQTMGLDVSTLWPFLKTWEKENAWLLAAYGSDPSDKSAHPVYVRLVARIYRVQKVSIQLNDSSGSGAELAAGIELPKPEPGAPSATRPAAEQYDELAKGLNASLLTQLGGKVRIVNASRRSILLEEEFNEPMVIGYLAYDCRILSGGVLSAPMPTYQRLTGESIAITPILNTTGLITAWYTADEQVRVKRINEWMQSRFTSPDLPRPSTVDFLSKPEWEVERRRMMRDLGIVTH